MKTFILPFLFLLAFPAINKAQELHLIADHHLTESTHALTLKYSDEKYRPASISDEDLDTETGSEYRKISNIIKTFESMEGLSRITFDKATQTFTIIKSPEFTLPKNIEIPGFQGSEVIPVKENKKH